MKKYSWRYFFLIPLLMAMLLAMAHANISYYGYIWLQKPNLYPGDEALLEVTLEINDPSNKVKSVPYSIDIYRIDADRFKELVKEAGDSDEDLEKTFSDTPVQTIKDKAVFPRSDGYWKSVSVSHRLKFTETAYYFVKLHYGNQTRTAQFHISKAGMIAKTCDKDIIIYTQNKKTGQPMGGMQVDMKTKTGFANVGVTDESGLLKLDTEKLFRGKYKSGKLDFLAYNEDDLALCSPYFSSANYRKFKAYVYTDRPVYRPSQEVSFRGVLRIEEDNNLKPPAEKDFKVRINDSKGNKIFEENLMSNEFGSISGSVKLGDEPPLGRYGIIVTGEGFSGSGNFLVEEYRKPEYEVIVTPEKPYNLQGDSVRFNVEAKYYFGAPVADTDFTYSVYAAQFFPHSYYYWWEDYNQPYGGSYVKEASGKTDSNGKAQIEVDTVKLGYDARYVVTVNMIDESRRNVTGSASTMVTRGEFYITMNTDKYFYSPADKVKLSVKTMDFEGNPRSEDVEIKITKTVWNTGKKEESQVILTESVKTGKDGKGILEFVPDRVGYFQAIATSRDSRENLITGTGGFYAAENRAEPWYNASNLEIKGDKPFYSYGDTMRLMISNPYQGTTALMTLEGDRIYKHQLIHLDSPVKILELKAEDYYAPNVHVSICFWKDGAFYHTVHNVIVPAKDKFLNVSIKPDKEKYLPREDAAFVIETRKEDGTPVSAEVGMGIADESVYAIASDDTPNIQKFFYGTRYNSVSTVSSYVHSQYYGPMDTVAEAGAVPPPASEPAPSKMSRDKREMKKNGESLAEPDFVREYFPDTCYFNPSIITDHKGQAQVNARMPDSLTTWRATARAASLETEVGQATEKVVVTKDLLARLITPRFLVEKDRVTISGIVHNYLDKPVEAHVSLESRGVQLKSQEKSIVKIEPTGKANVEWQVTAEESGEGEFTLKALTKVESDAMKLKIPILPHGVEVIRAEAGSTEDELVFHMELPRTANRHSAVLQINLSPSIAGTLINALDYLAGYPYGCVEQTMSRFIPNAVVQNALKEFDLKNEKLEKELPDMMEKGFAKIYDYQHNDGGWGWWKNDQSDPYMTAYVIYGLSLARKAGYKVEQSRLERSINWLKSKYTEYAKEKDTGRQAFILYAFSEAGVHEEVHLKQLFKQGEELDNYSKAILSIALHRAGMKEQAKTLLDSLSRSATMQSTYAYWKGKGQYGWSDNPVETTAYAVKALILIDPENSLIEKGIRYISVSRRGYGWSNTKDTAVAVLALLDYVRMTKEMNAEFTAILNVNGRELKKVNFTRKDIALGGVNLVLKGEEIAEGSNRITLVKTGPGRVYCAAALTYFTREELIRAESNGLTIKREYFLVRKISPEEAKNKEAMNKKEKRIPREDINPHEELIPLDSTEMITLKTQDEVQVVLTVEGDSGREYVMIEDMKPAGCEAIEEKSTGYWNWWYAQREYRDEKVSFFVTYFSGGKKVINYRLRAETPGRYRTLPATAKLMYFPEVGGRSNEIVVKIEDESGK